MTYPQLTLKPGKDKPVRHMHHWIFSGAIHHFPPCANGDLVAVVSSSNEHLGYAYVNRNTSITARMVSFDKTLPQDAVRNRIDSAIAMRASWFAGKTTNAYRLINAEGDGIPGLIVDRYNDVLVVQSGTAGIDALLPMITEHLKKTLNPTCIYEKSDLPIRREEKIGMREGVLSGTLPENSEITENGLKFAVDILKGQKTGFFLDQREMRQWVRELSKGKKVLNCFGYTGGFTVAALAGGAKKAITVDISTEACAMADGNIAGNGFDTETNHSIVADVFEYLRNESLDYDIVILDPPAFAKKKTDIMNACRGYKDINRVAIEKMPKGSLLFTSSCSYHIDPGLFQTVVFQAAHDAKRNVRIIGRHRLAPDHPTNIFHPETEYLKSLLLYID